jgi:hypothetical protein
MPEFCPHQPWPEKVYAGRSGFRYISLPHAAEKDEWEFEHPFRRICKHLARFSSFPQDILKHYTPYWFGKTKQHSLELEKHNCTSFESLISALPGRFYVSVTDDSEKLPLKFQSKSVVSFTWVPPWAVDTFKKCRFIELDTSFRALKPYVYSIPMGIHANESFPLAVVVGLSESIELYDLFFQAMLKSGVSGEELHAKPFVTDQHPALMSACVHSPHFLCLRHLIESFGSNSFTGQIVRRLAFSSTEDEFKSEVVQCIHEIQELFVRDQITSECLASVFSTFGLGFEGGQVVIDPKCWASQAISTRAKARVATVLVLGALT